MAMSGTAAMFSRLTNLRNVVKSIGSPTAVVPSFNRNLCLATRSYSVDINAVIDTGETDVKPKKKISKAMMAYLQRAKEYDEFMKKEVTEYEIGKRHLANMMGEDPDTFSQKDINNSIKYLFPSGLYDKRARPIMEAPERIFPQKKAAQFDESGRPHHFLFYTCKPHYNQVLYDIVDKLHKLNAIEDQQLKKGILPRPDEKLDLLGTQWVRHSELENKLLETLHEIDYDKFIDAINRLMEHPYAFREKDFIMQYRTRMDEQSAEIRIPELQYTLAGRPYVTVKRCKRKTALANVTVIGNGTGKITINGKDIRFFFDIQSREQHFPQA